MINEQSNSLLEHSIIYIGGVSAAGKTTVTQKLAKIIKRPAIGLDNYSNFINAITRDKKTTKPAKAKIAQQVVEDLIHTNATCIVEGVWIKPDVANEISNRYRGKFTAIYCGYPDLDLDVHLNNIKDKKDHWLARETQESAVSFIASRIKRSIKYKVQCELYGFPFIDFSDQEQGSERLLSLFDFQNKVINHPNLSYAFSIKGYM